MAKPLVTVITPASDAAVYLTRAVTSVLGQRYWNLEHIIVARDDLDYEAQLRRAGINDPRLRFITTKRPGESVASALNAGLAEARGSIVAPLMPTDMFYANRLDRLVPLVQTFGVATANRRIASERTRTDPGTLLPSDGRMRTLGRLLFSRIMTPVGLVAQRGAFEPGWNTEIGDLHQFVKNVQIVSACKHIPIVPQPMHELRLKDAPNVAPYPQLTNGIIEADAAYASALARLDTASKRMLALYTRRQEALREEFDNSSCTDALQFLYAKGVLTPSSIPPTPLRPASNRAA